MSEERTPEEIAEAWKKTSIACEIWLENLRKEIEPIVEKMVKIFEENDEYACLLEGQMEPEMVGAILNMNKEDLDNALKSLSKHDYDTIQALTLEMEESIKNKRAHKQNVMFGYWSALELLAKLGIFINEKGVVK